MICLFDSSFNKVSSGHEKFYNESLINQVSNVFEIQEIKPFSNLNRNSLNKLNIFFITFFGFLKTFINSYKLIIYPTPTILDIFFIFFFSFFFRKNIIFFQRRLFVSKNMKDLIIIKILNQLRKKRKVVFVSDSPEILKKISCKNKTFLISQPIRNIVNFNPDNDINFLKFGAKTNFGIMGVLREEKGVHLYEQIIIETLKKFKNSFFLIHAIALDDYMKERLFCIKEAFKDERRVLVIDKFLEDNEYTWIIKNLDYLVTPYDINTYTSGTSGPIFEALSLNTAVISTKLNWATINFKYSNIFFMKKASIKAYKEVLDNLENKSYNKFSSQDDLFQKNWVDTINFSLNL